MNKYLKYLTPGYILVLCLISCTSRVKNLESMQITSEPVFITGRIVNPVPENSTVTVFVNDIISGKSNSLVSLIDSSGNFQVHFNLYYSKDVLVRYGDSSFPLIIHPNDSIHITFDASKISDKKELIKTFQLSGNQAETNAKLLTFYYDLYEISVPLEKYNEFIKEASPDEVIALRDSLKSAKEALLNDFIEKNNPSHELKTWLKNEIKMDYYLWLARYPLQLAEIKNADVKTVVSPSFYDFMNIPLTKDMLCNTQTDHFMSFYLYVRLNAYCKKYRTNSIIGYLQKGKEITYFGSTTEQEIEVIEDNTNDEFLKQVLIVKSLNDCLERREIDEFEKHYSLFDRVVHEPFLKEPIINKYVKIKSMYENPEPGENSLLKLSADTPANELVQKIIEDHKGKVIYLDVWATWCSPCREEMPYSRKMYQEMNNDNVAFVYLCINSEEDKWKAIISEMELEGSHYLATPDQSQFVLKLLEISGVPHYVLIDKDGKVIEKGNHLRPSLSTARVKIMDMVNS